MTDGRKNTVSTLTPIITVRDITRITIPNEYDAPRCSNPNRARRHRTVRVRGISRVEHRLLFDRQGWSYVEREFHERPSSLDQGAGARNCSAGSIGDAGRGAERPAGRH